MSTIIAQAVGGAYPSIATTVASGTSVQTVTSAILTVGGQILNGRPFAVIYQGYVKSHGTSQTIAPGIAGAKYSTSTFSGTQLGTGTASGAMTAGTVYPFTFQLNLAADNTSGILTGVFSGYDGVTPSRTAGTVVANTLTGVTFGSNNIGNVNVTNPLASAQTPALQFCPTFTMGVSDTTAVVTITSFFATSD